VNSILPVPGSAGTECSGDSSHGYAPLRSPFSPATGGGLGRQWRFQRGLGCRSGPKNCNKQDSRGRSVGRNRDCPGRRPAFRFQQPDRRPDGSSTRNPTRCRRVSLCPRDPLEWRSARTANVFVVNTGDRNVMILPACLSKQPVKTIRHPAESLARFFASLRLKR